MAPVDVSGEALAQTLREARYSYLPKRVPVTLTRVFLRFIVFVLPYLLSDIWLSGFAETLLIRVQRLGVVV